MQASERLYFRSLQENDVNALTAIYSDTKAMQFRANAPILTTSDAQQMIRSASQQDEQFASNRFAIVLNLTDELIGTFVLKQHKENLTYTIGYSIGKVFWNKGYGGELLKAMVDYLKKIHCTLIQAIVHPENLASIRILKKQGFHSSETDASTQLITYQLQI